MLRWLKISFAFLLGVVATSSLGLWAMGHLFPKANWHFGNYHIANGTLSEAAMPDDGFLDLCWGNAMHWGFEFSVLESGVEIRQSWGWKRTNRRYPSQYELEQFPPPDLLYQAGWGKPGLLHYWKFHWSSAGTADEIWNSQLYIPYWVLCGVTSGSFFCFLIAFTVRQIIAKRRARMQGFPVIRPER